MNNRKLILVMSLFFCFLFGAKGQVEVRSDKNTAEGTFPIVTSNSVAKIVVDATDFETVQLSAQLFAEDVERVTGQRPALLQKQTKGNDFLIIIGTIGRNRMIDRLVKEKKIDADSLRNQWEKFLIQTVDNPFAGVKKALVIAGSDRRGTAYGVVTLSEAIGVSPWYWWADVPVAKKQTLQVKNIRYLSTSPSVKYRGIFINDEDWGLHQWASKSYDPNFGNIGPKTYKKVFELMLRLKLNYIWPAMHECSTEFGAVPENVALADRYGIVAGSSHCEPMLCNNVHWDQKKRGAWNYRFNRDTIHAYWKQNVKQRSTEEAVWTLGIRGIHDQGMQRPPVETKERINLVEKVITDQRTLIQQNVTKKWGEVAQCFVPYKEVLPLYDAGLKVPDDVTIMWVDDNFGYIRRLGASLERTRSGGAGVYWHLSYYGGPHSYLWINSTPPALMWEELHKAWENDARKIWVINVGDIKPMEIGMDYFAHFAWNVNDNGSNMQPSFLYSFAKKQFGETVAQPIANLLGDYYRLGTLRKPEEMNRMWALSLPALQAQTLKREYKELLENEKNIATQVSNESKDAYFEMVGFSVRIVGASGLIFLADREAQLGGDSVVAKQEMEEWKAYIDRQVSIFNNEVASGKWQNMMPGKETKTAKSLTQWNSQVRWPWGENRSASHFMLPQPDRAWIDANSADRRSESGRAKWLMISGLGTTGKAVALKPASLNTSWESGDRNAPYLEYDFSTDTQSDSTILVGFLPTFCICPGMQLRVQVVVDQRQSIVVEVPGSNGKEDENGPNRSGGIMNNIVVAKVALQKLMPGKHCLRISAIDPGVVMDKISFPVNKTKPL
jgi:hypothetical protein